VAVSAPASVTTGSIDQATQQAYAIASKSVVYVDNPGVGTGSGIIYDSRGDVVTNYHVVSGATSTIKITLNNGKSYSTHVLGTDPSDDLAVLRADVTGLTPATFATAGSFKMAQAVLAIGSPLGLRQSVSFGVISGLNRVQQEPNGAYLPNAIQTSAPINPGNSGGALVTLDGVVVGMPTLEQTSTNDGTAAQGIGFAIPSTRITFVANQIIANGKVTHTDRPYLGISPTDPSTSTGGGLFGQGGFFGQGGGFGQGGQSTVEGAYLQQVAPTGPAAKAGIQQGDTITAIDGTSVTDAEDLLTVLATKKPGDTVTLKVYHDGSTETVKVRLSELPG
jgi:S1-C subfamily serine protease